MIAPICNKTTGGVTATRVSGWDSSCEAFIAEGVRDKIKKRALHFGLLQTRTTESFLIRANEGTPLLFLGIVPVTLLGFEAYIWMIPFKGLHKRYLRDIYKMFKDYANGFGRLTAQVFDCETVEERFLKFFGFTAFCETSGVTVYERIS